MVGDVRAVKLGSAVNLYPIEYWVDAFRGGIGRQGFLDWCHILGVTPVGVGEQWFVDPLEFELALQGAMDALRGEALVAPGFVAVARGTMSVTRVRELEEWKVRDLWRSVLKKFVLKRKVNKAETADRARVQLRDMAERLRAAGLHVKADEARARQAAEADREVTDDVD